MSSVQHAVVGQVVNYEGVYHPHWEIGHIRVRVPRRRKLCVGGTVLVGLMAGYWLGFLDFTPFVAFTVALALWMAAPAEERWQPHFAEAVGRSVLGDPMNNSGGPIAIEFEGIITARGRYGHKGIMNRQVEITRVVIST